MTTKSDLVASVANATGQTQSAARPIVEAVFDLMAADLVAGKDIRIAGFGNFAVKKMKARTGVNPRSGEKIAIPERNKVTFKPAADLRARV